MKGLTYFAALMALFAAMILAQSSSSTPSGQSNSSQSAAQSQNGSTASSGRHTNKPRMQDRASDATASSNPIRDQQPASSTTPSSPQLLTQTPAARAAATHTPDPGTCMNPAALEPTPAGTPPHHGPPCD
jgi:hypothetical protein